MRRFVSLLLLATSPGWGWWETGHRVVARIAASHLTPAARTRVARILGVADEETAVTEAMAAASTWADQVKAQNGTGSWHFVDLALQDRRSDIEARCPKGDCLTDRMVEFANQLKEHTPDPHWSEADAIRYLIHFAGDAHQPLHAATDADLGGNCESLTEPFHLANNLHALWDGGIIGAMDGDDRQLAAQLEREIGEMPEHERHRWSGGNEQEWIWESHEIALKEIYDRLHIPVEPAALTPHTCADAPAEITAFQVTPDPAYIDAMKPVVRMQLTKAGLRLAKLLNETL